MLLILTHFHRISGARQNYSERLFPRFGKIEGTKRIFRCDGSE
jgi:hypothetical protein